jgi:hypothetical protein
MKSDLLPLTSLELGDIFEFETEPTTLDDHNELHFAWHRLDYIDLKHSTMEYTTLAQAGDGVTLRKRNTLNSTFLAEYQVVRRSLDDNPLQIALESRKEPS